MRKKSSSFLRRLEEELGLCLCVYEEVNCLSERMCKCGIVWDVCGDQLCFVKQSSEIPISKIHEATSFQKSPIWLLVAGRYTGQERSEVGICSEKCRSAEGCRRYDIITQIYKNQLAQEHSPYLLQHAHNPMPFSGKFLQKEDMQNLSASALFIRFSWHWRML